MATIKTAISLDETLFKGMNQIARKQKIPRSQLFARAVGEFLQRQHAAELTESWNRVYSSPDADTDEDRAFRKAALRSVAKRLKDDKW